MDKRRSSKRISLCLADPLPVGISIKYRKALLDEMVVKIIEETVESIQQQYAIEIEALGMDKDHIHLLSPTHPKISPGEIVRIFKSITAREIFRR